MLTSPLIKLWQEEKHFGEPLTLCKTSLYDMERIIYWVVSKKSEGRSPFCEVTPKIVRGGLLMAFFEVFLRFHSQTWGPIVLHLLLLACCCLFLLIYLQKNSKLFQFFTTESNIRKLMFFYWEGEAQIKGRHALSPRGHLLSQLASCVLLLTENVIFFLKKKFIWILKRLIFWPFFWKDGFLLE